MKILSRILALLALVAFACAPTLTRAQDTPPPPDQGAPPPDQGGQDDQGASFQTFYDQLGDQGSWIQTDNYGYVFQPNVSDPNWAPYTDGHWVYTDQGWTWVSDESWGWATYHYGRWANIDGTGWVWVPGYRWAPAWVSWRYGGGYAGWAPLPPETFVGAEYGGGGISVNAGFHFGSDVDVNFNIGPGCYNFVNVGDLGEPNYGGRYIDRSRNYTVINNTTNVTNINVTNNYGTGGAGANFRGVSTGGPAIADVNAHSHTQIQRVQLTSANQAGRSSVQGNSLAIYAPRVNAATARTAKPASVARTVAHPTLNRGDSITKPMAVNASLKPAAPSAEAIAAAKEARAKAPATARIATEKTRVKTPLTKPLTAMKPVVQTQRTTNAPAPAERTSTAEKPAATSAEHPAASSAFTGESEKPTSTYHPQTEAAPASTYHPQTEEKPASTSHPETEEKPAATYHPETQTEKPAVSHSETEEKPASSYHPQTEEKPASHPQSEPSHEATHSQAPAAKPAAAPSGNKGGDNKDQPQNH
jgi:hypothetical protein